MRRPTTAIFDLDGTLSDSARGITKSLNHAVVALGHVPGPDGDLLRYIGPPLDVVFAELLSTSDEGIISSAIGLYRDRYTRTGYTENELYEGIAEVLACLHEDGCRLCIATSKREDIAAQVLDHLGIAGFFSQVHGCDLQRSKADLLRQIVGLDPASAFVMVGDRASDIVAASAAGIPSIGVRWGYGSDGELARASRIVTSPRELPGAVRDTARPAGSRDGREHS